MRDHSSASRCRALAGVALATVLLIQCEAAPEMKTMAITFRPYSYQIGETIACPSNVTDPASCLSSTVSQVAKALRTHFQDRASVSANPVNGSIELGMRVPIPDQEGGGQYLVSAELLFLVRLVSDQSDHHIDLVPRIFTEVVQQLPGKDWLTYSKDPQQMAGQVSEEVFDVVKQISI